MKARPPKGYKALSRKDQEKIKEYIVEAATEAAIKQEEHDCRIILDIYMKMVCCMLHDSFGFGEKRLNYFLGNHKRVINRQNKLVTRGQQLDYFNKRMAEIFPKNGFPQEFINSIIGEIELVDTSKEKEE